MDNEIKILIERFMAGLTSIEEEDRLAEYFRTHDVDDSLREYKEMFAWFDRGMPLNDTSAPLPAGNNNADDTEVAGMRRSKTPLRALYIVAAAAAAVLLLIVTLPRNHSAQTVRTAAMSEPQTVRPVPAPADTVIAETFVQIFQYVLPLVLADLLHGKEVRLLRIDELHHSPAAHRPGVGVGSIVIADIECPCKDGILIPFDRYIRFPSATGDRDSVDYSLRLA